MKDKIENYKEKLEKSMCEYMDIPVTERSAEAVKHMAHCWKSLDKMENRMSKDMDFSEADAIEWVNGMINSDGTTGAHWTQEQTSAVAESIGLKFDHVCPWAFWAAMNMIYSDYFKAADKFGVNTAEFYAEMAKDFLFDEDAPEPMKKLNAYYNCIIK